MRLHICAETYLLAASSMMILFACQAQASYVFQAGGGQLINDPASYLQQQQQQQQLPQTLDFFPQAPEGLARFGAMQPVARGAAGNNGLSSHRLNGLHDAQTAAPESSVDLSLRLAPPGSSQFVAPQRIPLRRFKRRPNSLLANSRRL